MIVREISWRHPFHAFAPLAGRDHAHLLHGGEGRRKGWSIIVAEPASLYRLQGHDGDGWLAGLDALIASRSLDPAANSPAAPFLSGLVGYIGYEALGSCEPSLALPPSPYGLPDAAFGVYDAAAVFCAERRLAYITGRSAEACDHLESLLGKDQSAADSAPPVFAPAGSNFSRNDYEAAIAEVIARIRDGDFFQANIAQTLAAQCADPIRPFDLFRSLARSSDAFFAGLLQYPGWAVLSNSPERFFRLDERRRLSVEPIKGTRARDDDPARDLSLAEDLLADPKDRAENIMIADLMRNDLSRVCRDHSIRVEAVCELISLSRVHHLVSRISGELREEETVGGVLRALFPSGSITGAPKIEAMQTIADIERRGRGPYCGAIGYIDDRGGADFCVSIRTMMADLEARRVFIPVGGGVTLRSDPAAEYEETLVKARAGLSGLGLAPDGFG